jgi:hypothetical protein
MSEPNPSATTAAVRNKPSTTNKHTACRSVNSRAGTAGIVGAAEMGVISAVDTVVAPAVL